VIPFIKTYAELLQNLTEFTPDQLDKPIIVDDGPPIEIMLSLRFSDDVFNQPVMNRVQRI
jgi:hypothetical protein